MSLIGDQIKYYRTKMGLSMEELGDIMGVSRQTIFRYETGAIENIPRERTRQLAQIFGITEAILFGFEKDVPNIPGAMPISRRVVPVLGDIACGAPCYADEDRSYVYVEEDVDADFCLRAKGDSMIGARIYDGDTVFVRSQDVVESGEIAVVIIDDEATLKRVYYYPDSKKVVLMPENPAYAPIVYSGRELEHLKIIGRAVAFRSAIH